MIYRPLPSSVYTDTDINIQCNNQVLQQESSVKFLGLNIDQSLNWRNHCTDLIKKLNSTCYQIRNLKNIIDLKYLLNFYYGQVHSRLCYGVIFWGSSAAVRDVFLAQKRIIRCIVGIKPTDSCRPYFRDLNILPLPSIYILEILLHVFRNRADIMKNGDYHSYNTRNKHKFSVPLNRLTITKRAPMSVGVKLFNSLPDGISAHSNIKRFKSQIRSLLVQHSIYSVEEFLAQVENV